MQLNNIRDAVSRTISGVILVKEKIDKNYMHTGEPSDFTGHISKLLRYRSVAVQQQEQTD